MSVVSTNKLQTSKQNRYSYFHYFNAPLTLWGRSIQLDSNNQNNRLVLQFLPLSSFVYIADYYILECII